ncbi:hypothetical protein [Kitasatospora indigofera]|uniref:hypothetical protein n=1 Tax=Kitasatospora indigofera TaxID=67307 RepID=UPI00368BCF81
MRAITSALVAALMGLACVAGATGTANAASSSKPVVKPAATYHCYQWVIAYYDLSGNPVWKCKFGGYI